jgi:hypothetical protein
MSNRVTTTRIMTGWDLELQNPIKGADKYITNYKGRLESRIC